MHRGASRRRTRVGARAARLRDRKRYTLPPRATRLIGRERELATLRELLSSDVRLVTLVGPPGIGKTRLALEAAAVLEGRFSDGVAFIDLSSIHDPALVMSSISQTLGIRDAPDRPILRGLTELLSARSLLLVLDNLEQVVAAAKDIGELIDVCPDMRVLATSREPLHLPWEREFPVPPLETQYPDPTGDGGRAESAAVTLFVERVRAAVPDFEPLGDDAHVVREICIRLDGLPLAIEMAAARVKALPPREILRRLGERFTLLTAQGPGPLRHQTLRHAIAWSYDLLSPLEQRVFRRVGAFQSGFALESADAVCGAAGLSPVLPVVMALVDKSLVHADVPGADGAARFRLLESLREFALEMLGAAGESEDAFARHAAYVARVAEAAAPELRGAAQRIWFERLERDQPDLRAALEWCLEHDPLLGLRLAWSLFWFWDVRGHWREGMEWLERAVQAVPAAPPIERARAIMAAGHLAFHVADYAHAHARLRESIMLLRSLDQRRDLAEALLFEGVLLRRQSEFRDAVPIQEESLALFTETGDAWGMLFAHSELARLARLMGNVERALIVGRRALTFARETGQQREISNALEDLALVELGKGELARAEQLLREALKLHRAIGMKQGEAACLVALGESALLRGRDDEAKTSLNEGLALYREIGDRSGIALALVHLSTLDLRRRATQSALELLKEAFTMFEATKEQQGIAVVLEHLAATCAAVRQYQRAAQFLAAAEEIRGRIGAAPWPIERARIEPLVRRVRGQLGSPAFRGGWEAGALLSPAEIAVEVLATSTPEVVPSEAGGSARGLLTRREAEVAGLIAGGKSNREIAAILFISERTADNHVQHVLNKLGFTSRSQIAAWAVSQGLVGRID